jgi:hypothetical protein
MKFTSDIDLDLGDRTQLLEHIGHIASSIRTSDSVKRHNTGIHPTRIPYDVINNMASIDYKQAADRGYIKLDLLNVWVYKLISSEEHLHRLMKEPADWSILKNKDYFSKLIHIGNHHSTFLDMPEPICSIDTLAMFLALIRPGKRHLIGKSWAEVSKTIWDKSNDGYHFKKSHSISYSQLVVIHMNLLCEQKDQSL